MNSESRAGFTLIELLIVIGIVAILATVTLLVLNPAEVLEEGRDSNRLSEIVSLDKTIGFAISQVPPLFIGSPNIVYISIPDTATNCSNISSKLPALAAGWSYHCASEANFRKIDGTGWLPVDFQSGSINSFSKIPVDPRNSAADGLYYSYVTSNGRWEFNVQMESTKYGWKGSKDVESGDGGNTIVLLEKGSNLNLMPKEVNARFSVALNVPESCSDGLNPHTSAQGTEVYARWSLPGSKKVAVTALSYYQPQFIETNPRDGLDVGESIEMALYEDKPSGANSNNGQRLSEIVVVNGNGQHQSWVSSTLAVPIEIDLGKTYIFGMGPNNATYYDMGDEIAGGCSGYLPNGSSSVAYLDGNPDGLGDKVSGSGPLGLQLGIPGIGYAEN
ncbi:MAG: type II secretion system protein [Candidatus Curtissbacteria bacterium]|nr:type II secretion system protein [Candidatus Curtissbacteria bacterium]